MKRSYWPEIAAVLIASAVVLAGILYLDQPAELTPGATGWVDLPAEVAKIEATQPIRAFADTPAFKANPAGADDHAFLWQAATKVLGKPLPARSQGSVGSCVSFGTASACEHSVLMAKMLGKNLEYKDLCQEAIYALSRVEVGGGRIRGDGSVGAWAAEAVQKWGVIPRETIAGIDLSKYDEKRCRQWGSQGLSPELEAECKKSPVKSVTLIRSVAEAKAALVNGYPMAVCSGQGFSSQRDTDGFARGQGSWPHCMAVLGYRSDRPGFFIWNSWGPDWIRGPKGPGEPPEGGFWCEENTFASMLRQGDTWAFADAVGFPARRIDWFVLRQVRTPAQLAGARFTFPTKGRHTDAFSRN